MQKVIEKLNQVTKISNFRVDANYLEMVEYINSKKGILDLEKATKTKALTVDEFFKKLKLAREKKYERDSSKK